MNVILSVSDIAMITVASGGVTDIRIISGLVTDTCDSYTDAVFSYPLVATEPTVTFYRGTPYYYELIKQTRI